MFHLNCHSDYSFLKSCAQIKQIVKRLKDIGAAGAALTDYNSLSGAVDFLTATKKEGLKAVVGSQISLEDGDITVLAPNLDGWKRVVKLVSFANRDESAKVTLRDVADYSGSKLIVYTGYYGSDLFNSLFVTPEALTNPNYEKVKSFVRPDWERWLQHKINLYYDMFGGENFYVGIQSFTEGCSPALQIANKIIRHMAKLGFSKIALADPHYAGLDDAPDHRVILCSQMKCILKDLEKVATKQGETFIYRFLRSNKFYIPIEAELNNTLDEIAHTEEIAARCEEYDITSPPKVPVFPCEGTQTEYLKKLCRQGWTTKIAPNIKKEDQPKYAARAKHELAVLTEAEVLPSYFLIVQDYCNWARSQGMKIGERGSGAGCLTSFLLNITNLDPLEHDLIFERFYSAARKGSLPDIDVDFPKKRREEVIQYIRQKYGEDKVSHISTFGRYKGKSIVKEVLSKHNRCSFEEMNKITACIPNDDKISDHLQIMREARGEASAILWTLENLGDDLKDWCFLTENGLEGPFARDFEQAIRLEGCKRNPGQHASGIILSTEPLAEVCPMRYDTKHKRVIAALEMGALEAMGYIKLDILGSISLDKIMLAEALIKGEV